MFHQVSGVSELNCTAAYSVPFVTRICDPRVWFQVMGAIVGQFGSAAKGEISAEDLARAK